MAPPTATALANVNATGVSSSSAHAVVLKKRDGTIATAHTSRAARKQADRLKVIIRRLPPGLTKSEFTSLLGEEWVTGAIAGAGAGAGTTQAAGATPAVSWFDYKPGKISTDFSKPSRPARAYLNLTETAYLDKLQKKVLETHFVDAKNTAKDAALIDVPTLEFATYTRVALGKRKADARQGTIDQDPEFQQFLQSLTNPVAKPAALDTEPAAAKERVTTTPLIEHLREKKAAAKEKASKSAAAKAKQQQQQELKDVKGKEANKKTPKGQGQGQAQAHAQAHAQATEAQEKTPKKLTKAERAAKEAVKVLEKNVLGAADKAAGAGTAATKNTPERKPERAPRPMGIAARIQADLGLTPAQRRANRDAKTSSNDNSSAASSTTATTSEASNVSTAQPPQRTSRAPKGPKAAETPAKDTNGETSKPIPTGPAQTTLLKKPAQPPRGSSAASKPNAPPTGPKAQQQSAAQSSSPSAATPPLPTDPASLPKQAFLKHANPSQGITEPLIEAALLPYGAVTRVEIDRKKGFAYVDFVDNEGMKKAIQASPIKVAQGAVEVKERKEKSSQSQQQGGGSLRGAPRGIGRGFGGRGGGNRGGRGGGNRNGSAGASPAMANATPSVASSTSGAAPPAPPPAT